MGVIDKVTNKHRRMMERLVLDGLAPKLVSIEFDITESRLSILRRSPLWQVEEEKLTRETTELHKARFNTLLEKAVNVAEGTLYLDDHRLAHRAAMDIMDRAKFNLGRDEESSDVLVRIRIDE